MRMKGMKSQLRLEKKSGRMRKIERERERERKKVKEKNSN